jgi:hypothetical protein
LGGNAAHRRIAALALPLAASLGLTACGGGGKPQDSKEPEGTYPVKLIDANFPVSQRLAKDSTMEIVVQNAGTEIVPNINVTVKCGKGVGGSFTTATSDVDVADPQRPQFIVNRIPTATERVNPPLDPAPLERSTSFVDTYPLGPLGPGRTATFRWDVTAVKAGPFKLCWRVNAGLFGKAKIQAAEGTALRGEFIGEVSDEAPQARVGEDGKTVIEEPAGPAE